MHQRQSVKQVANDLILSPEIPAEGGADVFAHHRHVAAIDAVYGNEDARARGDVTGEPPTVQVSAIKTANIEADSGWVDRKIF